MRILWVFMCPLNHYLSAHGLNGIGAAWIESIFDEIVARGNIRLSVCFPYAQSEDVIKEKIDEITYYTVKNSKIKKKNRLSTIELYKRVLREAKPELIHIWGTEFPHILCALEAAEQMGFLERTVISLQGMCAAIGEHYYAGIPVHTAYGFSLRDIFKLDNIWTQKRDFLKRAEYEKQIIIKAKYVIGRTDYDYAYSTMINKDIVYYKCNETLRSVFQDNKWDYEKCVKHRILLSQGYYPIKGVHFVIDAVYKVIKYYPDTEVIIAGPDILRKDHKFGYLKGSGYAHYLRRQIRRNHLQDHVRFIGTQTTEEMCKRYMESNLFISASSTENESNSLGEAKMLGMPVIASFVGGVSDRIKHKEDGLAYQYDDTTMLARYICDIFENPEQAIEYGKAARENEIIISDKKKNIDCLEEIYKQIIGN